MRREDSSAKKVSALGNAVGYLAGALLGGGAIAAGRRRRDREPIRAEEIAQPTDGIIDGNLGIRVHIAALEATWLALAKEEIEEDRNRVGDVDRLVSIAIASHEGRRCLAKALDGAG